MPNDHKATAEKDYKPTLRDVPCEPCQTGYGGQHRCDTPDLCPCDQADRHATVEYEVWRSGPSPKAADVRLYHGLTEAQAPNVLAACHADKADGYPDAPVEFYLVRATTTREVVTSPDPEVATKTSGEPVDLLAALQRSIDAAKASENRTPPASEEGSR